jgi:type I restriction enzyme R subunit
LNPSIMNKKELSERDIENIYITPAVINAGWDLHTQIRQNVTLTPGPVIVRGEMSARNQKKRKFADYVLFWQPGTRVAVIEAKDNNVTVSHGLQQALGYADILGIPSAFSSNGDAFACHNKVPAHGEDIECELQMDNFPNPIELWTRYKQYHNIKDNETDLVLQPYYLDGSGKEPRYYQVEAINRTIEAVARGDKRILLVMATGSGKTYSTFQIIWRLWKARRAKRILFLVDRNNLADQTLINDFKPFGSVMTKIKNRKIDPSYEIHLGLYQALTGPDETDKVFKTVSKDFFDLIIIDECHRGSAAEDSSWREILLYFNNAIQIGLTATPKETEYVSNITYFGEPVYTYSLKQGIQDGFLAPYKVIKINIDKDIDGWTPPEGMTDDLGQVIENRVYNQKDMDNILILNQRTKLVANRVMQLLKATDPFAKTIIFCEDIDHAERMRKAIVNAAGKVATDNPKYVMRITGDSIEGKAELDNFIDPESRFPVIATTSDLMTTGVDAKTCKLIVLDKTINSMTTFKQIIGRGTRIDEENKKFFFTIMDFKKATDHFKDPDFDGEPVVIYNPGTDDDPVPPDPELEDDYGNGDIGDGGEDTQRKRFFFNDVPVRIKNELTQYMGENGQLTTESYKEFTRKKIKEEFVSLDNFLREWNDASKKQVIIDLLAEHGVILENLAEIVGKEYGDFDLICHIAFDQPPLTRKERANDVKKRDYFTKYGEQAKAVLYGLLENYADKGVQSMEDAKLLKLKPFSDIGTPLEIIKSVFGGKVEYEKAIHELENELFKQEKTA